MKRNRNLKFVLLTERSQPEKAVILYYSDYMTFWKNQKYGNSKEISGCYGLGAVDGKQVKHKGFFG